MPDTIDPGDGGQISLETPEVRFYPQDKRPNVITNTNIELYFSVDMEQDNGWRILVKEYEKETSEAPFRETTYVEPSVEGLPEGWTSEGVSWERRALVINPAISFEQGSRVTVEAVGFLSATGVPMDDTEIFFDVVDYADPTGTIAPASYYKGEVNPTTRIEIAFDQQVRVDNDWTVTVPGYGNRVSMDYKKDTADPVHPERAVVTWNGNILSIRPLDFFQLGETVTVSATGFKAVYGDMDVKVDPRTFTVSNTPYPAITVIPVDGTVGVTRFAPLQLNFTESAKQDSYWEVELGGVIYAFDPLDPEPDPNIMWISGTELILKHELPFSAVSDIGVKVTGFLTSAGQYPFAEYVDDTYSFTVQNQPGITTVPDDKRTDVSTSSQISFIFDELAEENGGWKVRVAVAGGVTSEYTKDDIGYVSWEPVSAPGGMPKNKLIITPQKGGQIFNEGSDVTVTVEADFTAGYDKTVFEFQGLSFKTTFVPVTGVSLDKPGMTLIKNATGQLVATVLPVNASNPAVTWTTSDPGVAKVEAIDAKTALVTAVMRGTATITVKTVDMGKTASCEVKSLAAHFIAVGAGGKVMNSFNGRDWTSAGPAGTQDLHSVAQGNGKYVAVGGGGCRVWSYDGITWNGIQGSYTPDEGLHHVAYGNGIFIAVGGIFGTNGRTLLSDDYGETWSTDLIGTDYIAGLAFGNGVFVAVGENGFRKWSDGTTWSSAVVDGWTIPSNWIYDIAWGNNVFIAVRHNGCTILKSGDGGKSWAEKPTGDCTWLHGAAFGDGVFVAAGEKGRIIRSDSDGDTWTKVREDGTDLKGVAYRDGIFVAVGNGGKRLYSSDAGNTWAEAEADGVTTDLLGIGSGTLSNSQEVTIGEKTISIDYVPAEKPYPLGRYDDGGEAPAIDSFLLSDSEVTWDLWSTVYNWAVLNGYSFANPGRKGSEESGAGMSSKHPVTMINWRDAMVWCNALTEYHNANNGTDPDLECVYYADSGYLTPIRDSKDDNSNSTELPGDYTSATNPNAGGFDDPYVKAAANGFRLPTRTEWELAARWRTDGTNTVSGYSDPWFTTGNSASGSYGDIDDYVATGDVAWFFNNSGNTTHEVKTKKANSLGLYDLSGNVWEWCFDESGASRIRMGGGYGGAPELNYLYLGVESSLDPWINFCDIGFRLAKKP